MTSPYAPVSRRRPWLIPVVVIGGVLLLIIIGLASSYNGLVTKQQSVKTEFANLDTQLQRRNDLIPQLVGAVRGALGQEQSVFGDLARARTQYAGATTTSQKAAADASITAGLGRLLVITENYPQLQSIAAVRDLQVQIEGTENRIAQERRTYNEVVNSYNTTVRSFPRNLIAGMFGFSQEPLFKAVETAATPPTVNLGGPGASSAPTASASPR
ncbi:MAG: LemA family protein [Actinomycetota bacterium]|nr:LemA family protein [Actinomycetota bacterium]